MFNMLKLLPLMDYNTYKLTKIQQSSADSKDYIDWTNQSNGLGGLDQLVKHPGNTLYMTIMYMENDCQCAVVNITTLEGTMCHKTVNL